MRDAFGTQSTAGISLYSECFSAGPSVVLLMEQLADATSPLLLLGLAFAYAIGAILLAVVTVCISPRGWMGPNFRKYLGLSP